ncbi:hypothetical protein CH333_03080 [candidate division WOR-3 bacterium JGI_Cruoil_03_44_89]|uniref:Tetratricopeptide repeat protein n=1 Tax=candidate division WOR-3 bacterium JGI_Cruoil_03_44_89 TaxID=1973748 RepID=A0A235BWR2_UNCW3|nr:MAG: hypothetical protein CH333_03080 [candidate division WOR-3 bacterium JGI_Cruoil_03_44_89]
MRRTILFTTPGLLLFCGCATRQISRTEPIEVFREQLRSTTEIKQVGSPTISSPYLTLEVEESISEKKRYEATVRYNKTLSTPGWIGIWGLSAGVAGWGTYDYITGKVVLGRDMIGVSVITPLTSYLFSKIVFSKRETQHKVVTTSDCLASRVVNISVKGTDYSKELTTDAKGKVNIDLRKFLGEVSDEPLLFTATLKRDPTVSKKFTVSSELFAQLALDEAKKRIPSCEFDEALSFIKKALKLDKESKEAREMLQKVERYKRGEVIDFMPEDANARYRLARLYYELGKHKSAHEQLREILAKDISFEIEAPKGLRQMALGIKDEIENSKFGTVYNLEDVLKSYGCRFSESEQIARGRYKDNIASTFRFREKGVRITIISKDQAKSSIVLGVHFELNYSKHFPDWQVDIENFIKEITHNEVELYDTKALAIIPTDAVESGAYDLKTSFQRFGQYKVKGGKADWGRKLGKWCYILIE